MIKVIPDTLPELMDILEGAWKGNAKIKDQEIVVSLKIESGKMYEINNEGEWTESKIGIENLGLLLPRSEGIQETLWRFYFRKTPITLNLTEIYKNEALVFWRVGDILPTEPNFVTLLKQNG